MIKKNKKPEIYHTTGLLKWKIMPFIMVNGNMDNVMVEEDKYGVMALAMKVIGKMIWLMEEED